MLCFAGGIYLVYERYQRAHNSPVPFEHHAPVQADPQWEGLPLENANLQSHLQHPDVLPPIDIPGQEYITAFDPATSLHLGTYLADDENVIAFKINKAAKAQRRWKQTTFVQRRRVVRSLLKWLVDNQEICAKVAARDTGKTRTLPTEYLRHIFTQAFFSIGCIYGRDYSYLCQGRMVSQSWRELSSTRG